MIAAPVAPEGSAQMTCGAQDLVAGLSSGRGLLPQLSIPPGGNGRAVLPGSNGGVASPRVVSPVCGGLADRLLGRDLLHQLGEHGTITHTLPFAGSLGPMAFAC